MKALLATLIVCVVLYNAGNWINTNYIPQKVKKDTIINLNASKQPVAIMKFSLEILEHEEAYSRIIDSIDILTINKD